MGRLFAAGLALWVGLAAGCGGGGGGDSEPTVPYTGLATEARVTTGNAEDLGSLAVGGTGLEEIGAISFRQAAAGEGSLGVGGPLGAARRVGQIALGIWQERADRRAQRPVRETWSDPGPCGGSVAFDITADDQTGEFHGSISFRDYCDEGVLRGGARFSGQVDLALGEPLFLTLSFGSLSYEDAVDRMAMGGTMSFDFRSHPTDVFRMTLNVRDEVEGKSYRFQDYQVVSTMAGDGADVVISGRCYHPDHGYVELHTVQPLHVLLNLDFPSSGALRADGTGGTWVLVTALSSFQCRVDADTDGDGSADWSSGPIPWTEL